MPPRELIHISCIVEAPRLYATLRMLEQSKAYNVEVRTVVPGGEAPASDEAPAKHRGRGRPAGTAPAAAIMRERVLAMVTAAGPDGAAIADMIKAIGPTRKGGIYQAAGALLKERKIERPTVGRYRLVNGPEPPPHAAAAPVESGGPGYRRMSPAENSIAIDAAPLTTKFDAVLARLAAHGRVTTAEIRQLLDCDKNAGDFAIKQLIAAKAMRRIGRGVYERH